MKELEIIFSANNNETIMALPVITEMPELTQEYKNEVLETINGEFSIIGNKALRVVNLNGFFPINKDYKFTQAGAKQNGWDYVSFFNKYAGDKVPLRMVILEGGRELSNMAYTVESFSTTILKRRDIAYSLQLKEYRFSKIKAV